MSQTETVANNSSNSTNLVTDFSHRNLLDGEFWRSIPCYADLSPCEFNDHRFQSRNCVTSVDKLKQVLGDLVGEELYADVEDGISRSPMSIRISPYILSLINWENPYMDPLRIQFLPLGSTAKTDHPNLHLDALNEIEDSPVSGLTHRYSDRALFLALDKCPVYCRFCTRSYAIGLDTEDVEKVHFGAQRERWEDVFLYIENHKEIEDIVVSGGDVANLRADSISYIGRRLIEIPHIQRMRFATKAPAVMPQKLLMDHDWRNSLIELAVEGRKQGKEVALHTHFNHPSEITTITKSSLEPFVYEGMIVRNQTVLQRNVNDDFDTMQSLIRRLGWIGVKPYYVFLHDMVRGVEDLRTTLQTALDLEKKIRGITAGYNTPNFVLDTMGGGGKRNIHSYEYYDPATGVAVYTSPSVRPGDHFYYFDPIDTLTSKYQQMWSEDETRCSMIEEAVEKAKV